MAGIYKDGSSFYLSWVEGGKQRRKSLGRITEAEAEAHRKAKEQELTARAAAGPLFAEWAVEYARWHAVEYPDSYPRVEGILRCHLIPAFGPLLLSTLPAEIVERYKATRSAEATPGTVVKELRTLRAMIRRAVALGIIARDPIAAVRAPRDLASRPPRWFTSDELAKIYATELTIPPCTTPADAELHVIYRWTWGLMANTGLRRGEMQHLEWSDIGPADLAVKSDPEARTKSGRWRSIPLSAGAREALEALPRTGATVLPPMAPWSLSRAFARTLARAGLDGRLHDLRHTYISHLVQRGIPLSAVQVLAGHSSPATTARYAHLSPGALRDAVASLAL